MSFRLSDLWTWRGAVDRGLYACLGIALFVLKFNLDRLLVRHWADAEGWPFHYWVPGDVFGVFSAAPPGRPVYGLPLAASLPFIRTGVVLTFRRLRSDEVIHRIHLRVLRHVKRLSETGP